MMTAILPEGSRLLQFQNQVVVFLFDISSEVFIVNNLSRSVSDVMPNSLNMLTPKLMLIDSALCFLKPFDSICVFEIFTIRPELFA